ncbi:hypothetical protein [Streptomyces sp. NPDC089919]|uniref:hypothetical protein n=1 Tax=Streptomyces sp. NPDC089919 TaxID=3155188 RepID=UPI00343C0515
MTIDHDAVLRARVLLLGSGLPSQAELVGAYRVLAEVSPKAYGPKLVEGLLRLRAQSRDPHVDVALAAEAVRAARRLDAGVRDRAQRLCGALTAHQDSLFALGRRAEARALCEELAAAGAHEPLVIALAEEGRFEEAAELDAQAARDDSFEARVRWAANLEGAGRHEEAAAVLRDHLDATRREAAVQQAPLAPLAWQLVHFSRMREAAADRTGAAAARKEALDVLAELAATGEPKPWGGLLEYWRTLFVLSGRAAEPAATPGAPMPAFGTGLRWSNAARAGFVAQLPELEARAARLRESERVPELLDLLRRIAVRLAVCHGDHPHRFEERFGPLFEEGVALARRLPDAPALLERALTDRSTYLVAAGSFGPAQADLAEATALLTAG